MSPSVKRIVIHEKEYINLRMSYSLLVSARAFVQLLLRECGFTTGSDRHNLGVET